MEKTTIALLLILFALLGYVTGYGMGVDKTLTKIGEYAPAMLDIELTSRAKMVLLSNPRIIYQVLTPESLEKLYSDLNVSMHAKGGIAHSNIINLNWSGNTYAN